MSMNRFLTTMLGQEKEWRKEAIRDEVNGLVIDTVFTPDTEKWETGIKVIGTWIIVEMYPNSEEAHKGHEKWCKECRENPTQEFKNCITPIEWAIGDY